MRSDRHFYSSLNYIHYNPVMHGLVESPYDWPWSKLALVSDGERQGVVERSIGNSSLLGTMEKVGMNCSNRTLKRLLRTVGCNGFGHTNAEAFTTNRWL